MGAQTTFNAWSAGQIRSRWSPAATPSDTSFWGGCWVPSAHPLALQTLSEQGRLQLEPTTLQLSLRPQKERKKARAVEGEGTVGVPEGRQENQLKKLAPLRGIEDS